ncbi:peroxiredoxin-like family protein [Nocardia albiluteola]|uniref:peroxiredoxin-like family protein n=1 Tax=Nocardia albiluteola TaxID=2842303 RepID=UPI0027E0D2CD|nr:peroxiredoxin-like family protein [Nocardia albiluteola]
MTSTNTTIAERVELMHQSSATQLPASALAAFGAEQSDLATRGIPDGVARPGTMVSDADLLDMNGLPTTLYTALANKPTVLITYRGAWCPYCNLALRAYQEQLVPALAERGVGLIALSPQHPDGSMTMAEKNDLTFTVLSDPGNQIARQLGILTAPTDEVREAQQSLGLDLSIVNADNGFGLPMPTVLIIGADKTIRWIDVHPNYATRTETSDILGALDKLD